MSASRHARLNIYLDGPELRQAVKIAAAKEGVTLSAYCLKALRSRWSKKDSCREPPTARPRQPGLWIGSASRSVPLAYRSGS